MDDEVQISAFITAATKALLEEYSRASGVKKARVIEDALRHHLLALQELPRDVIVHAHLVVSSESFERILERVETPRKPSKALRELMRGGD